MQNGSDRFREHLLTLTQKEKTQKQRIRQHFLALAGGAVYTLLSTILFLMGYLDISLVLFVSLQSIMWLINFGITAFFLTGYNLKFERKSLATPQMFWSQTCVLILGYYLRELHAINMMLALATLSYGGFGLRISRYVGTFIYIVMGNGFLLYLSSETPHFKDHLIVFTSFTFAAIIHTSVGSYFSHLRLKLRNQNEEISIRTTQLELSRGNLEAAKKIAEEAVESKTQFLAAASHDLRQPLHAIELYVGAIKTADLQRYPILLDRLDKSVGELSGLLSSLFDISKLDIDSSNIHISFINLAQAYSDLDAEFLTLSKEMNRPLTITKPRYSVHSDPLMLKRIIRTLISNALVHSGKGRVLVGFRPRGKVIRIEVWDSGVGIPADEQERIFNEFHQLNNPQRDRQKGLGLGLALIKRMCNMLEHPLGVRSIPGKGTVFWVDVPKAQLSDEVNNTECMDKPISRPDQLNPLKGTSVLFIDDEQDILDGMSELLSGWGCHAVVALNPNIAITQLKKENFFPDIIITDYRLAESVTGIGAKQQVCTVLGKDIPGLLITGDIDPKIEQAALECNMKLLQKPLNAAKLKLYIAKTIESYRKNPE